MVYMDNSGPWCREGFQLERHGCRKPGRFVLSPQTSVGRRLRFRTWGWCRYRALTDVPSSRSKAFKGSQEREVASRLCGESLLLATLSNLSLGVGNEGHVAGEDGSQLELVASVEFGALLAKLESMLRAGQGSLLGEELVAQGIFLFKKF